MLLSQTKKNPTGILTSGIAISTERKQEIVLSFALMSAKEGYYFNFQ